MFCYTWFFIFAFTKFTDFSYSAPHELYIWEHRQMHWVCWAAQTWITFLPVVVRMSLNASIGFFLMCMKRSTLSFKLWLLFCVVLRIITKVSFFLHFWSFDYNSLSLYLFLFQFIIFIWKKSKNLLNITIIYLIWMFSFFFAKFDI